MDRITRDLLKIARDIIAIDLPKKKWVKLKPNELAEYQEIIFDLIQTAYKPIGGHAKFKSKSDVNTSKSNVWTVKDIDGDGDPDAVIFGKSKSGIKLTGLGHDGSSQAKTDVLSRWHQMLKKGGYWAEVSGALAHIAIKRHNASFVSSQEEVEKLLGKSVKWVGEIDKYPGVDGWYERDIGGDSHLKIIVGISK
jgi:hypothetical protein